MPWPFNVLPAPIEEARDIDTPRILDSGQETGDVEKPSGIMAYSYKTPTPMCLPKALNRGRKQRHKVAIVGAGPMALPWH